ncbi:hypothetical protein Scep_001483 [Stephania cephalantha]|uniref:Uncharacterized protein n=1 Tax=Stephania cephalantha TaxID=152367 RepID=A0AAP0L9G8_9MAGN
MYSIGRVKKGSGLSGISYRDVLMDLGTLYRSTCDVVSMMVLLSRMCCGRLSGEYNVGFINKYGDGSWCMRAIMLAEWRLEIAICIECDGDEGTRIRDESLNSLR